MNPDLRGRVNGAGCGNGDVLVLQDPQPYRNIAKDFSDGMSMDPPRLPERYFYDCHGSSLFEKICATEEYYPTRLEDSLIDGNSTEIIETANGFSRIVELGSGNSAKTRRLFDNPRLRQGCQRYIAIDVSHSTLAQTMGSLGEEYPWLCCQAIAADYADALSAIAPHHEEGTLFLFLGGTIGNFHPDEARAFLRDLRERMQPSDHLLIGVDAVKCADRLNQAYNDSQDLTAQFNLNMLRVMNRELGCDFDLEKFRHRAEFDEGLSAVQMSLEATDEQVVSVPTLKQSYAFKSGERIITEHSYKYTIERAESLLRDSGLAIEARFGEEYHLFVASVAPQGPVAG